MNAANGSHVGFASANGDTNHVLVGNVGYFYSWRKKFINPNSQKKTD